MPRSAACPRSAGTVARGKSRDSDAIFMSDELDSEQSFFLRKLQSAWANANSCRYTRKNSPACHRINTRSVGGDLHVYVGNKRFYAAFPSTHLCSNHMFTHKTEDSIFWAVVAAIHKDRRDCVVFVEGKIPRSGCSSIPELLHAGMRKFGEMCTTITLMTCSCDRGTDVASSLADLLSDAGDRTTGVPSWYRHTTDLRIFDSGGGRWVGRIVKDALNRAAAERESGTTKCRREGSLEHANATDHSHRVSTMIAELKKIPGFVTRMRKALRR